MHETNFFVFFDIKKANKTENKIKQDNKQSKEIGCERLPLQQQLEIPGNGARKCA